MSDDAAKYLDTFPGWLRTLGSDAEELAAILGDGGASSACREAVAGGLNYLFKSLDLIPDGIDDIGYLDDAFVLRVAADLANREDPGDIDVARLKTLGRLTNECELLREFLGKDYKRLEDYVNGLRRGAARGRSVSDIVNDAATREDFTNDISSFARGYTPPAFTREEKNLIKLKSFFDAKLPS